MRPGLSVLFLLVLLAMSCSATYRSKQNLLMNSRGAVRPTSQFEIVQLKNPVITVTDQVAVTFSEETMDCEVSVPRGESPSELNFVCLGGQSMPKEPQEMRLAQGYRSFLWVKDPGITHLWVNRLLYDCEVDKSEPAVSCRPNSTVRSIASPKRDF